MPAVNGNSWSHCAPRVSEESVVLYDAQGRVLAYSKDLLPVRRQVQIETNTALREAMRRMTNREILDLGKIDRDALTAALRKVAESTKKSGRKWDFDVTTGEFSVSFDVPGNGCIKGRVSLRDILLVGGSVTGTYIATKK
jgi:hypothetical protein